MSKKITEQSVKTVRNPASGSMYLWDAAENGFGLRVTATGKKSFVLAYRIGGRQRRYTIGSWPDFSVEAAKTEAGKLRVGIRSGNDPLEDKHRDLLEPTISDLLTAYMKSDDERKKRPSSQRNDRSMLEKIIRPRLGRLRLKSLRQQDIKSLHRAMEATPYRANRVLALLSAVFNYGIAENWPLMQRRASSATDGTEVIVQGVNPVHGIAKYEEEKRECFLTPDQMEKLQKALDKYADQNAANALRLLMLTGSREMEVLAAQWEEFDLDRGVWTKPKERTKQKKDHYIPLNTEALDLLASMAPVNLTGPLFPGRKEPRTGKKGPRTTLRRAWKEVCKKAGLTEKQMVMEGEKTTVKHRPLYRIHDLRHNFASVLASANVSLLKIGNLLGHSQPATTARYAHFQVESQRDTANIFGAVYRKAKKKTA